LSNVVEEAEAEFCEIGESETSVPDPVLTGLVLRANSGQFVVQPNSPSVDASLQISCTLRGNLRKSLTFSTSGSNPRRVTKAKQSHNLDVVAVGDRVVYTLLDDGSGIIEEVLPRSTRFARSSFRGVEQTMITNLDQLVVVFACAEPNPDLWRIDRWLIAAKSMNIEPLLVANKRDKVSDEVYEAAFGEFARIGYRVIATSARTGQGLDELQAALRGRISAFSGPSGVGKSSLLNAIQPGLKLATGEVGEITFKGKHTTTVRELIPLTCGGWVADTPGLRNLELLRMDRDDLIHSFDEFAAHIKTACRFRNCKHLNEPGCNIKEAVESGAISRRRYESFLQLARECEAPAR